MKVSVILPIYNVSNYVQRCLRSLLNQDLSDVEYIIVDDCSQDNSMDVVYDCISAFPDRKADIKIIRHETNKGLPQARNTGLSLATGEFIYHCDSDDYLEENMLRVLYETAVHNRADFVWCDYYLTYANRERKISQYVDSSVEEALGATLRGYLKYNVWNKLVRRDLYEKNKISFPSGHSMGEDMTMILLLACAHKIKYVEQSLYHYVKNNQSAMTQCISVKQIEDVLFNAQRIIDFLNTKKYDSVNVELFKLSVKLPLLISDDFSLYKLWNDIYPESNEYIFANSETSCRIKIVQYLASRNMYRLVWLNNKLIHEILYKILYN